MRPPILLRHSKYYDYVRQRLPRSKFRHCISTAEFMAALAVSLRIDIDQAVTAGLLHDLCRAHKAPEMLRKAQDYGLPISAFARKKPNLLHGPLAAEECRRVLGVQDPAIYEAIYWHTTGRPGLDLLGQALYFADFAEPTRTYPEAEEARRRLKQEGFHPALCWVAQTKIGFLLKKHVTDPITEEFRRWLDVGAE